jgi:hypothetical protein
MTALPVRSGTGEHDEEASLKFSKSLFSAQPFLVTEELPF